MTAQILARFMALLRGMDARLLVFLVTSGGLWVWLGPWPVPVIGLIPACTLLLAAHQCLPGFRKFFWAYASFSIFWTLSYGFLQLWEQSLWNTAPTAAPMLALYGQSLLFGLRLFVLVGFGLVIPLTTSAISLGRVLVWFLQGPAWLEKWFCRHILRNRVQPALFAHCWRAGLTLAVMVAFLPRACRSIAALGNTLKLRAPHLSGRKRMTLLCMVCLRLLGTQTWDTALSIASRDLYRPEPWQFKR